MQRDQAPPGVKAPPVAAVLADGGRLQLCDENRDARSKASSSAKSHWHEYKAGVLQILKSDTSTEDPCADLPEVYSRPEKIDQLAREMHGADRARRARRTGGDRVTHGPEH